MTAGTEVGLGLRDIVLDGAQLPCPKGAPSNFRPMSAVAKRPAGWTKMPLGMEVGLGPGDCVRWEPCSLQKKGIHTPTQFLAHVYCGQTAGWIKMPLGAEVNLGPGDVALDGVAAPPS